MVDNFHRHSTGAEQACSASPACWGGYDEDRLEHRPGRTPVRQDGRASSLTRTYEHAVGCLPIAADADNALASLRDSRKRMVCTPRREAAAGPLPTCRRRSTSCSTARLHREVWRKITTARRQEIARHGQDVAAHCACRKGGSAGEGTAGDIPHRHAEAAPRGRAPIQQRRAARGT